MNASPQVWLTVAVLLGYVVLRGLSRRFLVALGRRKGVPRERAIYVAKYFNIVLVLAVLTILAMVWGVDFSGMLVLASSVFAVAGVALVAQWSILSNITASVIIFFTFPARIGSYIRVVDGDNSVEGVIHEITLFQILIKGPAGQVISYPNNLLVQKPVVIGRDAAEAKLAQGDRGGEHG